MAPPKYISQLVNQLIRFLQTRDQLNLQPNQQGMKSLKPILSHLYALLCSLVSYEICQGNYGDGSAMNGFDLGLEDMVILSSVLFKELRKCLHTCFDNAPGDQDIEMEAMHVYDKDSREGLLLLLRCCILMVRCNPFDQVLSDEFKGIVGLLYKLCTQGRLAREEINPINGSCVRSSSLDLSATSPNLSVRFLQQMLEVYLDETFADKPFRECIAISESLSLNSQTRSICSSLQIESVLEIIAAHFLLLISGRDILETFAESLIWMENGMLSSPEVSLRVVSSLINHPVMTSAPTLLISHLISLASEVIGIRDPDARCVKIYVSTFCDSINLYCKHMSKLNDFHSLGRNVQSSFESHFHSETYTFMLGIMGNNWRAQSSSTGKKTATMDKVAISYITMNIKIVDKSYRDNVISFLSLLVRRIISVKVNGNLLQSVQEMTKQDHCLLASILKLMSCSLLQATHCFEKNLSYMISLMKGKDAIPVCKSQGGLMNFFSQSNLNMPIEVQEVVVDALKPHLLTCEEFELIFLHFTGLLSVCIFNGLDMLVKGCLFLMLVLLDTLALELGSSEFLKPSASAELETSACSSTFVIAQKSCVRQLSSLRVASNFVRERQRLLRDPTGSEVSDEKTCSGDIYLRYSLDPRTTDDFDELADFIECKPYRNYKSVVSNRCKRQRRRFLKSIGKVQSAMMQARR